MSNDTFYDELTKTQTSVKNEKHNVRIYLARNLKVKEKLNEVNVKEHFKNVKIFDCCMVRYAIACGFTLENPEILQQSHCVFCKDRLVEFQVDKFDTVNRSFSFRFKHFQPLCRNEICDKALFDYVWPQKKFSRKLFESIGSNTKYLSLVTNKNIEDINFSKSRGFRELTFRQSKNDLIKRYGETEGLKRYYERIEKIREHHSSKPQTWINKYGEEIGLQMFEKHFDRILKHNNSKKFFSNIECKFLEKVESQYNFKIERFKHFVIDDKSVFVDGYCKDKMVIFEFFGDYWHCNPSTYAPNYFHAKIKKYAKEIWKKDEHRLSSLFKITNCFVISIWEKSFKTNENECLKNIISIINEKVPGVYNV